MATSNTYNFQNTPTDAIIKEAFERCGLSGELISGIQGESALSSLNYMFSEWVTRGLNLFAVDTQALSIIPAQNSYPIANATVDLLEGTAVIPTRQLNGTAYSSAGGVAQNAFDGNPNTSCTQTAPNGWISYSFVIVPSPATPINIQYIGVQSNIDTTYTIVVEYSYDFNTWFTCYNPGPLKYIAGIPQWFVPAVPQAAINWRIRETGGAILDIQEIYFDTHQTSRLMTRISREDYMAIPNKYTDLAVPSTFLVYRTDTPTLILWPNPDSTYQLFVYTRKRYIQDVSDLVQNVDSPQRFYEAVASGLAARMALKYFSDKYALLAQEADRAYNYAAQEDVERVPLSIAPDRCYEYTNYS